MDSANDRILELESRLREAEAQVNICKISVVLLANQHM